MSVDGPPPGRVLRGFLLLTAGYVAALVAIELVTREVRFAEMARALPALVGLGICGMLVRYLRWHWLLARRGHDLAWRLALPAFLAGFAFTATPGKIGELVRLRYFSRAGVPHSTVVACFVVERGLDLLVVLAIASLIAASVPGYPVAVLFVALVIAGLLVAGRARGVRLRLQHGLRSRGRRLAARIVRTLLGGVEEARRRFTGRDLAVAALLGLVAWGLHCAGLALGLAALGIGLEPRLLFAIPAAAMLVGAASMLPGGVGATETAMVVMLTRFGEPAGIAMLAAVTLRLGSIWFSMLVGLAAVAMLERRAGRRDGMANTAG